MHVEYFGMGNLSFQDSKDTLSKIKKYFPQSKSITSEIERTMRYLLLPPKTKLIRRIYPENETETNAAIEILFRVCFLFILSQFIFSFPELIHQLGLDSVKLSALHNLFSQCVSASAFQQLRTVEQVYFPLHVLLLLDFSTTKIILIDLARLYCSHRRESVQWGPSLQGYCPIR